MACRPGSMPVRPPGWPSRAPATWRAAHVPEYAVNHRNYLRACGLLWGYFNSPETLFRERFGDVADPWTEIRRLMKGDD